MPYAIIAYNSTVHSTTKFTPYELTLGHTNSRDPLDLISTTFYSDYVSAHKNKIDEIYKKVTTDTENQKEKIISKSNPHGNQTSEFQLNQKVYKRL